MKTLTFAPATALRTATVPTGHLLTHLQLWQPAETGQLVTGEGETAAVILSGTFDLSAGGTTWPARGARKSPLEGRPMAVFLPPRTDFQAGNGRGEIVLIGARQPAVQPVVEARAALSRKPLLPLAGSGKAFDPASGAWMPAETFPTSPESLPPRRMERITVGDQMVERVFAPDYKALTLSLDEVVLSKGGKLAVRDIPRRPASSELLLFVRAASGAIVRSGTTERQVAGDAAFWLSTAGGDTDLVIEAGADRAYVLLAYAGK